MCQTAQPGVARAGSHSSPVRACFAGAADVSARAAEAVGSGCRFHRSIFATAKPILGCL